MKPDEIRIVLCSRFGNSSDVTPSVRVLLTSFILLGAPKRKRSFTNVGDSTTGIMASRFNRQLRLKRYNFFKGFFLFASFLRLQIQRLHFELVISECRARGKSKMNDRSGGEMRPLLFVSIHSSAVGITNREIARGERLERVRAL